MDESEVTESETKPGNSLRAQNMSDVGSSSSESERGGQFSRKYLHKQRNEPKETENSDEDIGPTLPTNFKPFITVNDNNGNSHSTQQLQSCIVVAGNESNSEEEPDVGPAPPPGFKPAPLSAQNNTRDSEKFQEDVGAMRTGPGRTSDDEDDDDDASTEDDVSNDIQSFIYDF